MRRAERVSRGIRRAAPPRAQSVRVISRGGSRGGVAGCRARVAAELRGQHDGGEEASDEPFDSRPGIVEIDARWREMTGEELIERGLHEWLPPTEEEVDRLTEDYEP